MHGAAVERDFSNTDIVRPRSRLLDFQLIFAIDQSTWRYGEINHHVVFVAKKSPQPFAVEENLPGLLDVLLPQPQRLRGGVLLRGKFDRQPVRFGLLGELTPFADIAETQMVQFGVERAFLCLSG